MFAKSRKVSFYVLAAILGLVVIEAVLQIAGAAYNHLQRSSQVSSATSSQATVILCLGESTTAWGLGESFPAQLQKILDERAGTGKYVVINEGLSATNTDAILARTDELLEKYRPQIVVTMMGINDYWGISSSRHWSDRIKLLKLFKLIAVNKEHSNPAQKPATPAITKPQSPPPPEAAQASFKAGENYLKQNKMSEAASEFKKYTELDRTAEGFTRVGNLYYNFYGVFHREGQKNARYYYDEALRLDPNAVEALIYLGCSYLRLDRNTEKAQGLLERALALKSTEPALIGSLADIYFEKGQSERAVALLKENLNDFVIWSRLLTHYRDIKNFNEFDKYMNSALEQFPGNRAFINLRSEVNRLRGLADETPRYDTQNYYEYPATVSNYEHFAKKVKEHKLRWIAVQYPHRPIDALKKIVPVSANAGFVDLNPVLSELEAKSGYDAVYIDRFGGDFGHFTPEAARRIAAEIAKTIL